jgi:RNA polymerase sigma factor (sigma-70 family)
MAVHLLPGWHSERAMPTPTELLLLPQVQQKIDERATKTVRSSLFSPADLDDIRQELTCHLYQKLGRYTPDRGDLLGFVYRVLRNKALNLIRERESQVPSGGILSWQQLPEPVTDCRLPGKGQADTTRALDLHLVLEEFVAALPPQEQLLAEGLLGGGTIAEAARAGGVSRAAVYAALRRWRKRANALGLAEFG